MTARAGAHQLDVHQYEYDRIEPEVRVQQPGAQCRTIQEALMECNTPRRVNQVSIAPDRACIVGTCCECSSTVGRGNTQVVEHVVDADEE